MSGPVTELRTELTEVADGVYVHLQPDGGWCLSNAGVIAGPEGLVLVDTAATAARAAALREAVDGLGRGPVRVLVNTHHHGDHTHGNGAFGGATVVAHARTRAEMVKNGLALTGVWPDVAWGELSVRLPDLTFTDELTLYRGDREIRLLHLGPAHTNDDVVAWLPEERVLFAGDVAMAGSSPFVLMGSVSGSLAVLARLRALRPRTVVCGHGPVRGPEVLDETEEYLRWIQRVAAEGRAQGLTPLVAAKEAGKGAFSHLTEFERVVGNLHRAYAELDEREAIASGRTVDVAEAFGEMITYNGGSLPTCHA
ncbi:cyclase [Streptomyces davaonensis JCM 4913]|uniref:Cyclase n=1 Tax=Streptomyces davaonensis (strain DSM 101723 / JCM 4913 / KCC S-0913 / 768) TaxID=1214101 RepID=K4R0L0_STRDJ|nr:MBL fold metallo-hydrolase [Streptomyces davaonensis]CCK26843.1 cyclase [Streptomyces davaonensis JCM 4913]